jgi:hypothetical protein
MNDGLEKIGRELSCLNLKYYPGIFLEALKKTTENSSQESQRPDRDFNLAPPEYDSRVLLLQQPHLYES